MSDPKVPHFDLPFRLARGGKRIVAAQQGTQRDVANCVEAILRCPFSFRPEVPEFGIHDYVFTSQPLDFQGAIEAVYRWEPRAIVTSTITVDALDALIARVGLDVARRESINYG